jgi:hypothetical protein
MGILGQSISPIVGHRAWTAEAAIPNSVTAAQLGKMSTLA